MKKITSLLILTMLMGISLSSVSAAVDGTPNPALGGPNPALGGPNPALGGPNPALGGPNPALGGPKGPITIIPDSIINTPDSYETTPEGYTFLKNGNVGLKVETPAQDIKDALGLNPSEKYVMVTVAARPLDETQLIDGIDSKISVNSNIFDVAVTDVVANTKIINGEAFPNVESSFYDDANNQIVFKGTSDQVLPSGKTTDIFSYILKVKKDNSIPTDSIVAEGSSGDNQGLIILTSSGNDLGKNLFAGKVAMNIVNIPSVAVQNPIEKIVNTVALPVINKVAPQKIETGAAKDITLMILLLLVISGSVFVLKDKKA